ncbi:MAG: TVP38/TMEM64 family protein [Kiloniellales bacterium]
MSRDIDKSNVREGGEPAAAQPETARGLTWRRLLPLLVLIVGLLAFFALGLDEYATVEALREHRQFLLDFVGRYGALAGVAFMLVYATVIAFSVPGGVVMTLAGGFLFGTWWGTLYVAVAATLGATVLFVIVKHALGDAVRAKVRPWLGKMEDGFNRNAFSYLLSLRLFAVFPFWVVNLVPAFLGVRLRTYVLATMIGILPATFIFASVGAGLGAILDAGGEPDLGILRQPKILFPLLGLALLALLPVAYQRYKKRGDDKTRTD